MTSLIINALNLGNKMSGLGRYTFEMARGLLADPGFPGHVAVNTLGVRHFGMPRDKRLQGYPGFLSPDYGFFAHAARLAVTNVYSWWHPGQWIFNTSQLEGVMGHRRQVLTIHDLIPLLYPREFRFQHFYMKHILPKAARSAARIVTGTEYSKGLIVGAYSVRPEKIAVIPYGISDFFLNQASELRKENYILCVGRFLETKNIGMLLRAFAIFRERRKDVTLRLVGPFAGLEGDGIEVVGHVTDDDLARLYRHALLYVSPSLEEGFGFTPLEAMACGCLVAVSRSSCLPEVCGNAALYFSPHNPEEMASVFERICGDAALRETMAERGRRHAVRFTWGKSTTAHCALLMDCIKESG